MERAGTRQGYKILIVDDEDHIRRILQFQLEKRGYRVVQAENGEAALEIVRRELPDLILLDLMMPKMDGFETCHRIRQNFQTAQIPIIMLTAKSELPDKIKGLQDGANDYLTKPYSNEELLLRSPNAITDVDAGLVHLGEVIHVLHVPAIRGGMLLHVYLDGEGQQGMGIFGPATVPA